MIFFLFRFTSPYSDVLRQLLCHCFDSTLVRFFTYGFTEAKERRKVEARKIDSGEEEDIVFRKSDFVGIFSLGFFCPGLVLRISSQIHPGFGLKVEDYVSNFIFFKIWF